MQSNQTGTQSDPNEANKSQKRRLVCKSASTSCNICIRSGSLKSLKDLSCLGLGDLDKNIVCRTSSFGTDSAVFTTGAEVPLPAELEEGVVD